MAGDEHRKRLFGTNFTVTVFLTLVHATGEMPQSRRSGARIQMKLNIVFLFKTFLSD